MDRPVGRDERVGGQACDLGGKALWDRHELIDVGDQVLCVPSIQSHTDDSGVCERSLHLCSAGAEEIHDVELVCSDARHVRTPPDGSSVSDSLPGEECGVEKDAGTYETA